MNIFKEDLVSFETAKLAKEKGFSICTLKCYDYRDYNNKIHPEIWFTESRNFGQSMIFAPTQSLLQKWLREECNIFLQIDVNFCYKIYANDELETESSDYNNYEQALEKGLIEALKLIK